MASATPKPQMDRLYAAHHGWLQGWLRRRLGDSPDAADIAQDTFLRLLTGKRRETSLGPEPRALLVHIAKGVMIDRWRRQEVERAYLEALRHLPAAAAPSAEERLIILETLMAIEAVLADLPVLTRRVFLLAQIEGLTLEQISERTGTPVITVRRHVKKALLACMAAEGAAEGGAE